MQHQHFDVDLAVAVVHKTFEQMRSMPNVGRDKAEREAIDLQRNQDAENLRVAFTRYYFGRINEGIRPDLQAHMVGVILADCVLDWVTGYDLAQNIGPVHAVVTAFNTQLNSGVTATLQGDTGAVSNVINSTPSGRA